MADSELEWDPHGFPPNAILHLNQLSDSRNYKVSGITLFDKILNSSIPADDPFFDSVSLILNSIYKKSQLQKELETLTACGMFSEVDLEVNSNQDGSINITIPFIESIWEQHVDRFRCTSVGALSLFDKLISFLFKKSRPCLLPAIVEREILQMLIEQGNVSSRLLRRIQDRVDGWYHEKGYACAQVVNFGNLGSNELVCEVVEGEITKLVIQFRDELGKVCTGNTTWIPLVERELLKWSLACSLLRIEALVHALEVKQFTTVHGVGAFHIFGVVLVW